MEVYKSKRIVYKHYNIDGTSITDVETKTNGKSFFCFRTLSRKFIELLVKTWIPFYYAAFHEETVVITGCH